MGIKKSTIYTRVCDVCGGALPEDHNKRAWVSYGADFENGHNGDTVEYTQSFDVCFPCLTKVFPKWRTYHD